MADISKALSIADLRLMAHRRVPKFVFDFIDGGAEDEITLQANRQAIEDICIAPRVLVDVSSPKTATRVMGSDIAMPLAIAPMGSATLGRPEADFALARAAWASGIPYGMSTMSTVKMEDIADIKSGPLWFQLYVLRDEAFNNALIDRADAAGFDALVVTVDLPTGGKRERDLRNGISMPLKLGLSGYIDAAMHPGWALDIMRHGSPVYRNVDGLFRAEDDGLTIAHKVGRNLDAAFDWDKLKAIRDRWPRKLAVKGVQHPDDARRMAEMGIDCIWVSNHGGRQLDGAEATIVSLPRLAAALKGKADIVVDSGFRRGVDILKARMLGADAVAIGRPALFGAIAGGEVGAKHAIGIFRDELERAMKLTGVADINASDAGALSAVLDENDR